MSLSKPEGIDATHDRQHRQVSVSSQAKFSSGSVNEVAAKRLTVEFRFELTYFLTYLLTYSGSRHSDIACQRTVHNYTDGETVSCLPSIEDSFYASKRRGFDSRSVYLAVESSFLSHLSPLRMAMTAMNGVLERVGVIVTYI